jgi:hypothetical protein
MVRIGIRWQIAALVLISSLIGLAVVTIATWVGSPSAYHCPFNSLALG